MTDLKLSRYGFMRIFVFEERPSQPGYKQHAELAFMSVCILGGKNAFFFPNTCVRFLPEESSLGFRQFNFPCELNDASQEVRLK